MARAKKPKTIAAITHEDSRRNIPTAEYQSVMKDEERHPVQVAYERRNRDLDPQLVWRGKDEQDAEPLIAQAPPLYIQEKVDLQRLDPASLPPGGPSGRGAGAGPPTRRSQIRSGGCGGLRSRARGHLGFGSPGRDRRRGVHMRDGCGAGRTGTRGWDGGVTVVSGHPSRPNPDRRSFHVEGGRLPTPGLPGLLANPLGGLDLLAPVRIDARRRRERGRRAPCRPGGGVAGVRV